MSEIKYRKIKPSSGFLQKNNIKNFEIKSVNLYFENKKITMNIFINGYENTINEIVRLKSLIRKQGKNLQPEIRMNVDENLILNDIKGFIEFIIEYNKTEKSIFEMHMNKYEIKILGKTIFIELFNKNAVLKMKEERIFEHLAQRVSKVFGQIYKIEIVLEGTIDYENEKNKLLEEKSENNDDYFFYENEEEDYYSKNQLNEQDLSELVVEENNEITQIEEENIGKKLEIKEEKEEENSVFVANSVPISDVINYENKTVSNTSNWNNNYGKSQFKSRTKIKNALPIAISKIGDEDNFYKETDEQKVKIEEGTAIEITGKIFKIDFRETKKKSLMYDFLVTDYEDSISCRIFFNQKDDARIAILRVDDWVKVTGYFETNDYTQEKYIRVQDLESIESQDIKREDNAPKKRVELHAHTNMSEMSGVMSIKDYAKRAKEFGHSAIAVTDFGVVHSFPFAFKESNENFKIIYGVEAYVVDDEIDMITNPKKNMKVEEETYVIFDIETTGFDSVNDKIIEIGAIKMKGNGVVLEEFSEFVNPEMKIPENIVELTSITDEMVKDASKIEEVLPRFLEFCSNSTVVAHNAKFDVGFIKQKSNNQNLEFSPSVIDTLALARALLTEISRFGLANLVKYYNITLESHHRAIDDAKATAEIFKRFISAIREKMIFTLEDINTKLQPSIQNSETLNTIILVKNQAGLRDLYELVSKSHIDYFGRRKPRIPKSLLKEKRENFLIASSATATFGNCGELVNIYKNNGEKEEIEEKAKFYDYIEIQPPITYSDLITTEKKEGSIETLDDVKKMNEYFYELGKKLGKPVVATGDVHYLEERQFINRNVLLLGSGTMRKVVSSDGDRKYEFFDRKLYFRTTEEMLDEFSEMGEDVAFEVVVENTNKVADMIDAKIRPIPEGFYPPKMENAEEQVREMTYKRLEELYGTNIDKNLKERIEKELNSIIGNGFSVLYLIAQKLVKKSVEAGYLVGSRGSVGSSIVAYLMGITEVNGLYPHYRCPKCKHTEFMNEEGSGVDYEDKNCPKCGEKYIKDGHAIPFEVFMGFNGDKVPDIDLNFSGEYQSEIHKYTEELFGADNVFRAGTISTLAEKNAFGYVKKYLEEKEGTPEIKERKAEIMRLAKDCEGARKTTGQHPGGMIVVPEDKSIYDFCPVQKPANDINAQFQTTHFDYHVMDEQLVKLDILGHDDPTTLRILQDLTEVDIYKIPLDDKKVMSLFSGTQALGVDSKDIESPTGTSGIPEFGTSFVKQMLVDTCPKTFAELVRISGLSHGTDVWLNNAQDYIKSGQATLSQVITVRDDIMNKLIDDGLDKSLAFKIMEFVRKGQPTKNPDKWKEYSAMMKEKGVEQWYIDSCEKIKYMFPKGHAVAYVMMAVRIAYFKVYYPVEFYTAFLNRKVGDFKMSTMFFENTKEDIKKLKTLRKNLEKNPSLNAKQKQELALYEILVEMYYRGVELEKPNILTSDAKLFKIVEDEKTKRKKIQLPLIAVDGLGEEVAKNIVKEREIDEFLSLEDMSKRTRLNKTVLKLMEEFGCVNGIQKENQGTLF